MNNNIMYPLPSYESFDDSKYAPSLSSNPSGNNSPMNYYIPSPNYGSMNNFDSASSIDPYYGSYPIHCPSMYAMEPVSVPSVSTPPLNHVSPNYYAPQYDMQPPLMMGMVPSGNSPLMMSMNTPSPVNSHSMPSFDCTLPTTNSNITLSNDTSSGNFRSLRLAAKKNTNSLTEYNVEDLYDDEPAPKRRTTKKRSRSKSHEDTSDGEHADGSNRTSSSIDLSPEAIEALVEERQLKEARLARKAALARANRQDKKSRFNQLEEEVVQLKQQLEISKAESIRYKNEVDQYKAWLFQQQQQQQESQQHHPITTNDTPKIEDIVSPSLHYTPLSPIDTSSGVVYATESSLAQVKLNLESMNQMMMHMQQMMQQMIVTTNHNISR